MRESDSGYERRDVRPRAVAWFALGLVGALLLTFIAIHFFETVLARRFPAPVTRAPAVPPPRLQADPASDLSALRAIENEILSNYRWVDRKAGVLRIPIERAMELTIARGLPARERAGEGAR